MFLNAGEILYISPFVRKKSPKIVFGLLFIIKPRLLISLIWKCTTEIEVGYCLNNQFSIDVNTFYWPKSTIHRCTCTTFKFMIVKSYVSQFVYQLMTRFLYVFHSPHQVFRCVRIFLPHSHLLEAKNRWKCIYIDILCK